MSGLGSGEHVYAAAWNKRNKTSLSNVATAHPTAAELWGITIEINFIRFRVNTSVAETVL
ncbi:MAG: hypothetical protein GQ533_08010 [Methanosarcinaceae archaeon]|nr:hypothetical protein [Methanosarcinaceae archaeon]